MKDPGAVLVCANLVTDPQLLAGREVDLVTANETAEPTWLRPLQIVTSRLDGLFGIRGECLPRAAQRVALRECELP
jgi:hypothetical protein